MSQLLQFFQTSKEEERPVAAPTFQDLTIDDQLTDLQRIVRYTKSNIALQRLVHVRLLADVAEAVGFEDTHTYIIPLLESLSLDSESAIRQGLLEQVALLVKVWIYIMFLFLVFSNSLCVCYGPRYLKIT